MKDSTILKYIYSILNDKSVIRKFAFTQIGSGENTAGLGEAQELIIGLHKKAQEKEADGEQN